MRQVLKIRQMMDFCLDLGDTILQFETRVFLLFSPLISSFLGEKGFIRPLLTRSPMNLTEPSKT